MVKRNTWWPFKSQAKEINANKIAMGHVFISEAKNQVNERFFIIVLISTPTAHKDCAIVRPSEQL